MPSIYTHYKFSNDVLNKLPKNTQKIINDEINYYHLFAQSFDFLMYYNFISLKPGKKIRNLSITAHDYKTNDYFINIINHIKNNNLQNNPIILNYLYGSLTHFALDSTTHPFINYYALSNSNKFKYKSNHTKNETYIDAYLYNLDTKKNYNNFKIYQHLLPKIQFDDNLKKVLDTVYLQTFHYKNIGTIYEKSYNQSSTIYKFLLYDPYGIKKFIYKIIDYLTFYKENRYEFFSFHVSKINYKVLNLNHEKWCNPKDNKLISNDSFIDLYKKALQKAVKLINIATKIINNKEDITKLTDILLDKSYRTGLDWHDKRIMKYFKN